MRVEISSLFHLLSAQEPPVTKALIGSGVYLQKLDYEWIEGVRKQCSKVSAREELESQRPYTHRFFYELKDSANELFDVTPENQQPILRAISLSRIVKPTSIPYSNVWVRSTYDSRGANHFSDPVINAYSVAFGLKEHEWNTLTDADAAEMSRLWDSLSYFLDDKFEPTYRRIVRAFKYFELAHAIYFAEMRHVIIHAALESMICTSRDYKRAQIVQRLQQLISSLTSQQAEDIYKVCCDFKHAAQAILQHPLIEGGVDPSDQPRIDAVRLLHEAVRHLLRRSLEDRLFADILADTDKLKQTYQVLDGRGKLV